MFFSYLQKSGQIVRNLLPFLSAILFVYLSAIALPIPYWGGVTPMLGLMAVFYWSIYRPDLFRPFLVFVVGLLNDLLHALPIGLSAVLYLSVYQMVYAQRRFFVGQVFYVIWTGFSLVALLAALAQWIVVSLFEEQVLSVYPVLIELLLTIFIFPLPTWILIRVQRAFLAQDR